MKMNIITNTIIETETMMTIIIVISMEGEDFLVTFLTFKTPAIIRLFR
jgi:hypothetical protein